MTLLIGTRSGIWADRRISDSSAGTVHEPTRKVRGNAGLVAGFAGDFAKILAALDLVRSGEEDPEAYADLGCDGVIVTRAGALYTIDTKRLWAHNTKFVTQGSGYLEAKAFLAGRGACHPRAVRAAHRYVASVRTDCGDGVDFVSTRRRKS